MSIYGFRLSAPHLLKQKDCLLFDDHLFKMMMLKEVVQDNEKAMTKIFKCREKVGESFYALSQFPKSLDEAEAFSYIREKITNRSLAFRVSSFYRIHRRVALDEKRIAHVMRELLKLSQSLDRSDVQVKALNMIREIDNKLWRNIFTLYASSFSSNILWTERVAKELMHSSPYAAIFYHLNEKYISEQIVVNFLIKMSSRLIQTVEQRKAKYLISHMASLGGRRTLFKQYQNRFNAQWSLNELRDLFTNVWLRFNYFDFFIDKMMPRASEVEMKSHMREALCVKCIREANIKQLWFVKYFFPKEEVKRKLIRKKLISAWRTGDLLERYIVIDLLKVPHIKKYMEKGWSEMERGYFKVARDYYRELLSSGQGTDFALYQLYKLGDYSDKHLWWLAFK